MTPNPRDERRHAAAAHWRDQFTDTLGMGQRQRRRITTRQRRRNEGDYGDYSSTTFHSLTGFLRRPAHQKQGAGEGADDGYTVTRAWPERATGRHGDGVAATRTATTDQRQRTAHRIRPFLTLF